MTPWTVAHQAPLSMGFSRQECWSGLPCPPPGDLPDPGIEPVSLMSPALAGGSFTTSATWEAHLLYTRHYIWCLIINTFTISFKKVALIYIFKISRGVICPRSHMRSSKPQFGFESEVPHLSSIPQYSDSNCINHSRSTKCWTQILLPCLFLF